MNFSRYSVLLPAFTLSLCTHLGAQDAPVKIEPPKLTEAQVASITKQLAELEQQIMKMRGDNLTTVLQRLRAGVASDQAAMKLYLECEQEVTLARKEVDRTEARRREQSMEKNMDRKGEAKDENEGDPAVAARFHIQYLILCLEAHETSDDDMGKKMVPKLQTYIQDLTTSAPKLKGRAMNYLTSLGGGGGAANARGGNRGGGGGNSPVVEAFQLARYLDREGWTTRPTDIGGMFRETILPAAELDKKDSLPDLYDSRINAELAFRKGIMHEPEYLLWGQNELPSLRWQRAVYLYEHGPAPITAMADMLKLIRDNPGHADSPKWLKDLRGLVEKSTPGVGVSTNLPPGS